MSERHPPDKLDVLQKYWVEAEEECGRLRARVAELEAERKRLQCLLQASESLKGGYLDCMAELEAENKQLHRQLWIVGGIEPPIELRKEWDREEH